MSNYYATWGNNPDRDRVIVQGSGKKILMQKTPYRSETATLKTVCMECAGLFPTVVAKRYDSNPRQNDIEPYYPFFPFDVCVTGFGDLDLDHQDNLSPIAIPAADGARVYLLDYGFGLDDLDAHEGDIYFRCPYGRSKTSTVSQYVYDVELQIFGVTVPRKTYAFNINCKDVTQNADYNPDHPEVYTRYNGHEGYSVMIHWPGLHIKREADWSTYINDTYVGKWNPQWRTSHIYAYLAEEGHTPEDLIPPRIKD